ncbi:hypothetical protein F5Y15DRAFT_305973 [Xylariaceae sp. FL0016]|nr:hypothetical protein F5Y15DRAFT_305973 [Xylariaceae sp. FL0016]
MKTSTSRLLATATSQLSSLSLRNTSRHVVRPFSQTSIRPADPAPPRSPSVLGGANTPSAGSRNTMNDLGQMLASDTMSRALNKPSIGQDANAILETRSTAKYGDVFEPYHFHIYAHKHNCHITVTYPDRNAIISVSAGQIGFKKSKRGSYDAAFQLCSYVLDKLYQKGMHREITKMEVALRGFGSGREACTKVLLGNEGRLLRDKIVKVSDATRLKFGGTRSPKPRRLG